MPLKLRKDFKCILVDKKTGNSILSFDAQQVGDKLVGAGFEGGGVASGNQSCTIQTEKNYPFNAFQHEVHIEGVKYIIASVRPSMRKKMGAFGKSTPVYILDLE